MRMVPLHGRSAESGEREPSKAALAAIEAEWPAIEADLDVVDAMTRMALVDRPSEVDWRRLRRAAHRALTVRLSLRTLAARDLAAPKKPATSGQLRAIAAANRARCTCTTCGSGVA